MTASLKLNKAHLKQQETEFVVGLAQGDHQSEAMMALEELVRRSERGVYVTLYQLMPERNDISDMTQEVLLRMCRSIRSLKNPKTFKYWLNRIVMNYFYDEMRKLPRKLPTISMDDSSYGEGEDERNPTQDIPDESTRTEERVLGRELDQQIQEAIASLPEQFRSIIVLREVQGLSYEEIASLTRSNLGTVKSRLARARQKLQEVLSPYLS